MRIAEMTEDVYNNTTYFRATDVYTLCTVPNYYVVQSKLCPTVPLLNRNIC